MMFSLSNILILILILIRVIGKLLILDPLIDLMVLFLKIIYHLDPDIFPAPKIYLLHYYIIHKIIHSRHLQNYLVYLTHLVIFNGIKIYSLPVELVSPPVYSPLHSTASDSLILLPFMMPPGKNMEPILNLKFRN